MNRKVIALVEDPFWKTKIENAVKGVGASTVFLSDPAGAAGAVEPGAPVIVVVDLARKDLKEKALAAGFDEVLSRPSFAERFADLVLKYLLPGGVRKEEEENELPEE